MKELSKKSYENIGEKPYHNLNSFRGINSDKTNHKTEIKLNNYNNIISTRINLEKNNNDIQKSRTTKIPLINREPLSLYDKNKTNK